MSDYVKLLLIISLHSQNQTIICLQNNKKFIIPSFVNSVSLSETYKSLHSQCLILSLKQYALEKCTRFAVVLHEHVQLYNVTNIRRKESMWYQNFNESINILQTVIIMFAVLNIAHLQTHLMQSLARDRWSDLQVGFFTPKKV